MTNTTERNEEDAQVLVVGAGPAGLMAAGDLAEAGVRVRLLERRPREEANLTRAFAVHARTLEQFDARGIAEELLATGNVLHRFRLFGTLTIGLGFLPSRFPFVLITPQYNVEQVLTHRAVAAGAEILRGQEVLTLRQDADGAELEVRDAEGRVTIHRARYVVGADGVRSTVRRQLGLEFPGESVIRSVMLADVRLAQQPPEALSVNATKDGFAFVVPFGDGWYRAIAWDRHAEPLPDAAPVDADELRSVLCRVLGTDFGLRDPRWISRFHSEERQVPRYRVGRVLLAGDAAHVHSPAGGMGMNTGIQDAANLAWKLAAVVQGHAGDALLDSYHAERHPVGRMVLRTSGAIIRVTLAMGGPSRARFVRNAALTLAGHVPPVTRHAALRISGIGIRYDAPKGSHALTGRRIPDLRLTEGGRLYEALRGGRFVLVAPDADEKSVAFWGPRIRTGTPAGNVRSTILVRPDGHAAWAADDPTEEQLRSALAHWLGSA